MKFFLRRKIQTEEKTKPHHGDVALWVQKCIDSCKTVDQTRSADRLIRLYENQYEGEVPASILRISTKELERRALDRWADLAYRKAEKKTKKNKNKK